MCLDKRKAKKKNEDILTKLMFKERMKQRKKRRNEGRKEEGF